MNNQIDMCANIGISDHNVWKNRREFITDAFKRDRHGCSDPTSDNVEQLARTDAQQVVD